MSQIISNSVMPFIMLLVGGVMLFSKKDLFSVFLGGAKEGLETSVKLLPTLVALITAVSMFSASGAADALAAVLSPVLDFLKIPAELSPLLIVRPVSGGAATAVISDLLEKYGPDSFIGLCVSVIAGSSDTIIYIVAVYFGAVGIKKSRHALPAALLTMIFCVVFGCAVVRMVFGNG